MRIVFLSPDLPVPGDPAGARVRSLVDRDGVDVLLALTDVRPSAGQAVSWDGTPVVAVDDPAASGADVAIALHWRSAAHLFSIGAARSVLLVDSFAYEAMAPGQAERVPAAVAYGLPVDVLAGGAWIVEAFAQRRPGLRVLPARAGSDRAVFRPGADRSDAPDAPSGPLRVAVDDRWTARGVASDAQAVLAEVAAAHEVVELTAGDGADARAERLRAADVYLMLDPVGGDGASVREAMACGAVPVVLPAGGQAEAIVDGVSGVLAEPDDPRGTARRLERLAGDHDLLARLRAGALDAATSWPGLADAGIELHTALEQLLAAPTPDVAVSPARLMGDAIAQAAILSNEVKALSAALHRVERGEPSRAGTRLAATWKSPRMAGVRRLARPVSRRVKPRLGR